MKTLMKTMTGMMTMIMTAAQRREELWTAMFALQVSTVVEKILKSFTVAVGFFRMCQSI